MRIFVVAIAFAVTIGGLFLFENYKSGPKEKNYAQIVQNLQNQSPTKTPSPKPGNKPSRTATKTPSVLPVPSFTATLTITPSPVSSTPLLIPISTPTATPPTEPAPTPTLSPTSTPSPTATATPMPTTTPNPTPEQSEKININTAGYEELQKITGVGPVIAQRIVDYRNAHGPFQKLEDIKKIQGIGDITFEKMKDEITI